MPTTKTSLRFYFAIAAGLWLATTAAAFAQQFETLPPNSVVGNVLGQSGPSFAVSFDQLAAQLMLHGGLVKGPTSATQGHAAVFGSVPNVVLDAGAPPVFSPAGNANLAQMPPATIKGNPTGSTANVQDFTIQGLPARGAPDANNDKILIFDNAAGIFKFVTPGLIASSGTSGVSSFGGLTGAITGAQGESVLQFTQSGTGAVQRLVDAKLKDVVSVKDFGAAGDGTTDDTAAMNAAHATGAVVFYPAGTYKFSTLNPIAAGGIIGQGRAVTTLSSTDTSSNSLIAFNNSASVPIFRDFALFAPQSSSIPVKPNGAGILLDPSSGAFGAAIFDNVTFAFIPIGIDFVAAFNWNITNCNFVAYNIAGVQVANTNNPDEGDSFITSSLFNGVTTGAGIVQNSSGGLKILGNKFLGGLSGYVMQLNSTSTGDLLIVGNSFENMSAQDIAFNREAGTGVFVNVVISSNQLELDPPASRQTPPDFFRKCRSRVTCSTLQAALALGLRLQLWRISISATTRLRVTGARRPASL
jgi:hypothetical protein